MARFRKLVVPVVIGLLAAACASTGPVQNIQPGERPDLETDEAGLWMRMDRAEGELRSSGQLVQDPKLQAYVEGIVCRLTPDYCQDVRIYIVRTAGFNASMSPNGAMIVWSGLLLRSQNEAQLAYVLGHELAHYIERHSLKRWRDLRATTTGLAFFQVATLGVAGGIAHFGALGSIMAFSRENERQADRIGFELMQRAGYRGDEAVKIWDYLRREREAADDGEGFIFFASHPPSQERRDSLAALFQTEGKQGRVARDPFLLATARHRTGWMRDELQRRDYERIAVLTDHLLDAETDPGLAFFMKGEVHRLRDEEGDATAAVKAYHGALKTERAPVETFRSLGLVLWSLDRRKAAQEAFRKYLGQRPRADDRAMVEDYINQLN